MVVRVDDVALPPGLASRYAGQFDVPLAERFPFVRELFSPVHAAAQHGLAAPPADAVMPDSGWGLAFPDDLAPYAGDLRAFLQGEYGLVLSGERGVIRLAVDPRLPAQGYRLDVGLDGVTVAGGDRAGVMYGVHRLEALMLPYALPALPPGRYDAAPVLTTRIYRSPVAPYYVDEALTGEDYYPDTLLDLLAHHGFNGIWLHASLRDFAHSPLFPTYGRQADMRLTYLRQLIARAARYHIDVYLYMTEPLGMAEDDPLWRDFPHLRGAQSLLDRTFALCTAREEVRDHMRESTAWLARQLPGLGGIIQISASEHHHHCWSHVDPRRALDEWHKPPACPCPRCADRDPRDVVAEVIALVGDGLRAEIPGARHIAWNWSWCLYEEDPQRGILERLPRGTTVMSDFERGMPVTAAGLEIINEEYSLRVVGPSPRTALLAQACRELGLDYFARMQLPVTHESPTIPTWPVYYKVAEKCRRLVDTGASGTMACWNFGNFPGISTEILRRTCWSPAPQPAELLTELAERRFGAALAPAILQAWDIFSRAADAYPLLMNFLYVGPLSRGPVMPLFAEPTGRPMAQAYLLDALGDAISEYTAKTGVEAFCTSLQQLADAWRPGVQLLADALAQAPPAGRKALEPEYAAAGMFGCQVRSALHFTAFIDLRDRLAAGELAADDACARMAAIREAEIDNSREALRYLALDTRIGFHGEAHGYLMTARMVEEKIRLLESRQDR